jgi:hypothetical protein
MLLGLRDYVVRLDGDAAVYAAPEIVGTLAKHGKGACARWHSLRNMPSIDGETPANSAAAKKSA